MNFRFTKLKVIGSIVIPLIIWIFILILGKNVGMLSNVPTILRRFLEIHDLANIFGLGNISLFIIEIVIIYVIWSLFQKKKNIGPLINNQIK